MAPKKSKLKKPKVKNRIAQPVKGIIERANDMCTPYAEARAKGGARAEKEIGEKAQKIIR